MVGRDERDIITTHIALGDATDFQIFVASILTRKHVSLKPLIEKRARERGWGGGLTTK